MIEATILGVLAADTELKSYVTVFNSAPAIFSDSAPEGAVKPYIIFNVKEKGSGSKEITKFNLKTEFWDYDVSPVNSRKAAKRMEELLDYKSFDSADYTCIRPEFFSGGDVEDPDPRMVRYNQLYDVRAIRKGWMAQL